MARQRILTGILLIALLLILLFITNTFVFFIFSLAVVAIACLEWCQLLNINKFWNKSIFIILVIIFFIVYLQILSSGGGHYIFLYMVMFLVWGSIAISIFFYPRYANVWSQSSIAYIWAIVTLSYTWAVLYYMHAQAKELYLLYFFALVICADTFAYAIGKNLGKHHMIPLVSPNKTWEGTLSGIGIPWILALMGMAFCISMHEALLMSVFVFITLVGALVGDLYVSMLKRKSKVKDSGYLLPGHGGILDRMDSIMGSCPHFMFGLMFLHYLRPF